MKQPNIDMLVEDAHCSECKCPMPRGTFAYARPSANSCLFLGTICNACAAPEILAEFEADRARWNEHFRQADASR